MALYFVSYKRTRNGLSAGIANFHNQNIALEALANYNLTLGVGNSTSNNALEIELDFGFFCHGAG